MVRDQDNENNWPLQQPTYPACERLATFRADEGGGNKVGVVVALEVHVQQLLLPESLLTLAAGVGLLSCVCAAVHHHVPLLSTAVVTHVTLEALLVLVGLLVLDEGVALVEEGVTVATLLARLDKRVLLAQMNPWPGREIQEGEHLEKWRKL